MRDPYPTFAAMRGECPVHRGNFGARFDLPLPEVMSSATGEYFGVLSYAGVQQVLLDGETFSSSGYAPTVGMLMGHSILEMDSKPRRAPRRLSGGKTRQKADIKSQKWLSRIQLNVGLARERVPDPSGARAPMELCAAFSISASSGIRLIRLDSFALCLL